MSLRYQNLTELTGVGPKLAQKICYTLGKIDYRDRGPGNERIALEKIQSNPYQLIDVPTIAFRRADAVALKDFGVSPDAPERHHWGNRETLRQSGALNIYEYRAKRQELQLLNRHHELEGVSVEGKLVWLPEELQAEWRIASFIGGSLNALDEIMELNETQKQIVLEADLNQEQTRAVTLALSPGKLMIFTGAAGTGKTTTLASIAKCAAVKNERVRVLAFSGKAAERAAETMRAQDADVECSTIHRALGYNGSSWNIEEFFESIVVIDEASMLPNFLLAQVLKALPPYGKLILTGDPNQLPPIGYGAPFSDAIAAGALRVHLKQNYRQAGQVAIFELAEAVRTRNAKKVQLESKAGVGLVFGLEESDLERELHEAIEAYRHLPLLTWQVICWKNLTRAKLNELLQAQLNSPTFDGRGASVFRYPVWELRDGKTGAPPKAEVRIGDKVVVLNNNYTHEVFNGQTAVVSGQKYEGGQEWVKLDFANREVFIPTVLAEDLLCLGYAVTAHKAQGSGWPTVMMYEPEAVMPSVANRLTYTAITRAETHFQLFSGLTPEAWWRSAIAPEQYRHSTLLARIPEPQADLNAA